MVVIQNLVDNPRSRSPQALRNQMASTFPKTTSSLDVLQRATCFCSVSLWTLQDLITANRPSVHSSRAGQDNNAPLTSHCQDDSFLDVLGVSWFVRARVYGAAGSTAFCFLEPWNVSTWRLSVCFFFRNEAWMLANILQNFYVHFIDEERAKWTINHWSQIRDAHLDALALYFKVNFLIKFSSNIFLMHQIKCSMFFMCRQFVFSPLIAL